MSNSWQWSNGPGNTFVRFEQGYGKLTVVWDIYDHVEGWYLKAESRLIFVYLGEDSYDRDYPPLQTADNVMYALFCRPDDEDFAEF